MQLLQSPLQCVSRTMSRKIITGILAVTEIRQSLHKFYDYYFEESVDKICCSTINGEHFLMHLCVNILSILFIFECTALNSKWHL